MGRLKIVPLALATVSILGCGGQKKLPFEPTGYVPTVLPSWCDAG
jgi:hypothetical protein